MVTSVSAIFSRVHLYQVKEWWGKVIEDCQTPPPFIMDGSMKVQAPILSTAGAVPVRNEKGMLYN